MSLENVNISLSQSLKINYYQPITDYYTVCMYWMPKLHFYKLNLVKGSPTPEPFYARGDKLRNIGKIY